MSIVYILYQHPEPHHAGQWVHLALHCFNRSSTAMAGNHSIEGPNVFSDTERAMLGFSIAVFSLFATFGELSLFATFGECCHYSLPLVSCHCSLPLVSVVTIRYLW